MIPPIESSQVYYLAGPTAVGKSEIAVELARRCNGEIVGADAFQVYEGLPILTAQPPEVLRRRVAHHLIGEIPLGQAFDVGQYLALARERIAEVTSRGKIAIVSGGTGLYFRALTRGMAELPPADPALRQELETLTPEELRERLAQLDPIAATEVDLKNPRRVIRAVEVCMLAGRPFSSFRQQWTETPPAARGVFLSRDRDELNRRISVRTGEMFDQGVVEEVARTASVGSTAAQVLGWAEINSYLAGDLSREACIAAIQQATRRYAKRQMTWFRKETWMREVTVSDAMPPAKVADDLKRSAGL